MPALIELAVVASQDIATLASWGPAFRSVREKLHVKLELVWSDIESYRHGIIGPVECARVTRLLGDIRKKFLTVQTDKNEVIAKYWASLPHLTCARVNLTALQAMSRNVRKLEYGEGESCELALARIRPLQRRLREELLVRNYACTQAYCERIQQIYWQHRPRELVEQVAEREPLALAS
jgi:hypothetical protein